jgi:hypothetical protein
MATLTVINEEAREVSGGVVDGRVLIDPEELVTAIDWELKPEGICRGDVCVPVKDAQSLRVGDQVDLVAVSRALDRPTVVDSELGVIAVGLASEERKRALDGLVAAPFTLPDLDGNLHELEQWRGRKRLLVAFSTW